MKCVCIYAYLVWFTLWRIVMRKCGSAMRGKIWFGKEIFSSKELVSMKRGMVGVFMMLGREIW